MGHLHNQSDQQIFHDMAATCRMVYNNNNNNNINNNNNLKSSIQTSSLDYI